MISDNSSGTNDIEEFLADIESKESDSNRSAVKNKKQASQNSPGIINSDPGNKEPSYNINDDIFLEDIDTPAINKEIGFSANKDELDILDLIDKKPEKKQDLPQVIKEKESASPDVKPVKSEKKKEQKNTEVILKGTKSWNTREPYTLNIDAKRLKENNEDLDNTFYFVQKQQKETITNGEMKRALFIFIRGSGVSIKNEYSGFISKIISSQIHELLKTFRFTDDKSYLFVYHLGVMTVYKIIQNIFQYTELGYCFKIIKTKENTMIKYLPSEFIKEMTVSWHNEYFRDKEIPYDVIFDYNELQKHISNQYLQEIGKNSTKLEAINNSIKNISEMNNEEKKRLKDKWIELFGIPKIFVYNRFIEQTIFKFAV